MGNPFAKDVKGHLVGNLLNPSGTVPEKLGGRTGSTLPEINMFAPENRPSQKVTIVFQPSTLRCDSLVSRRVHFYENVATVLPFSTAVFSCSSPSIQLASNEPLNLPWDAKPLPGYKKNASNRDDRNPWW